MPNTHFPSLPGMPGNLVDIDARLMLGGMYRAAQRRKAIEELREAGLTIVTLGNVPFAPESEFDALVRSLVERARGAK